MTDLKLRTLIAEACQTDREVVRLKETLDGMKAQIKAEAESREEEHVATEGGGWSWTMEGVDENVVRVTRPGDSLKTSIDDDGKLTQRIRDAAAPHFFRLFQQAPKWKLVPDFRDAATVLMGKGAGKLIKLVSKASPVSVSFETKDGTAPQ